MPAVPLSSTAAPMGNVTTPPAARATEGVRRKVTFGAAELERSVVGKSEMPPARETASPTPTATNGKNTS